MSAPNHRFRKLRTPSRINAKKKNKNKNTEAYHIHTTENQR